ncbi:MAG TPA: ATP--guanido phosphotransferase [Candidatus Ratteibacteria bacterium]|nr:ATP--guanido phosphotransferase [Candidatus Ratteibacteria bacterium]
MKIENVNLLSSNIIEEKTRWVFEKVSFDNVITSRVRMARNLNNYPFPHNMTFSEAKEVENVVLKKILSYPYDEIFLIRTDQIDKKEKQILIERRIISNDLIENSVPSSVAILPNERVSIMVNEEDHLRIQSIQPGLNLKEGLKKVNKIDNFLQQEIEYAFSQKIGYLTACPTNIGTGIRGSVLIHLPALSILKITSEIFSAIENIGIMVRGFYGEGSKPLGNIFQITTKETAGKRGKQIIEELEVIVNIILQEEEKAVERLRKMKRIREKINKKIREIDKYKSINKEKFLYFFSLMYLGKKLDIFNIDDEIFHNLFIWILNSSLKFTEKKISISKNVLKEVKL